MTVITFLFTDIEGSTRRWEADADAMRIALEAHDEVLRTAITDFGGLVFKHTGDGMCATFASPRAAVDATISAQGTLGLPVRMGIATGEAEQRDGDYFGAVLNRAARVMSAGHGGQILLDGATAQLLSGVELQALGERRLRDIAKPVPVYQILAPGLKADFPPLKTVDHAVGNLRRSSTSFVGREAALSEVQTALKNHRLVTLIGVGGVGKTRLAFETAARMVGDFPDGVWVIDLAALGDPAAVPDAVAAVLGITQQPGLTVAEGLAVALEGRSRLLIFDNCEHVLDAAADLIDAILGRSPMVKVLATSREGLQASDEQLWPVPSLDVSTSAAALFDERAAAVAPAVTLAQHRDTIVEICHRLDGIPLAIELAASRMQSMTVTEVRDRLDDRFRLLVGSRRGLERHQTLRHTVSWSYDLLDEPEKDLLATCSAFAGGFDISSAAAVNGGADEFTTLDILDSLVRKSLLVADRSSERTRFSILETIRQFAEEQLIESGKADAVRAYHARYFAGCETDVLALWDSPRQRQAYDWFATELANVRTAFRWAADHDDLDTATTIAHYAGFVGFWGDRQEGVRWAEELVAPARAVQHRRLAQMYGMASLCFTAGRIEDSLGYAVEGQAAILSGQFDAVHRDGEAAIGSGFAAIGQTDRWVAWCRNVIARRPETYVHAQSILVLALKMAGADDEAMAASEELLTATESTDNPNLVAWALSAYGTAQRDASPAAAYAALCRGLAIAKDSGSRQTQSAIAANLSPLAMTLGKPADALDYAVLSLRYYYDSGNVYLVRNPLAVLAILFDRLGHLRPAATVFGFAADPFTFSTYHEFDALGARLREVLGAEGYEAFARTGEQMTTAEMVGYALEQVDEVRAKLE